MKQHKIDKMEKGSKKKFIIYNIDGSTKEEFTAELNSGISIEELKSFILTKTDE